MSGTKDWRILVYVSAADDDPNPEGTTVDFTIDGDYLLQAPRIGGQRVDPLSGSAESLSWSAAVGDFSEFFTGNMTDGAGRMNVAGRLVRVQTNVNAAGYSTVWTGRLTGAHEAEGPGKYDLSFADERWRGHNLSIYDTASTSQLLPGGVKSKWKEVPAAPSASAVVGAVTATDVLLTVLDRNRISPSVLKLLQKDLKDNARPGVSDGSTGNFTNLRATVGGTQKEVVSFGLIDRDPLIDLERQEDEEDRIKVITVWLAWGSGQPSVGDEFDDFVLTLDGTDTSDDWPHHIGGASGVDPMQEVKDRYDEFGIRYDSNVFSAWDASTNPEGLIDHPLIPRLFFRIREAKHLLPWTEALYALLGLVPFVNDDGEISPKFVFLQQDVDPTTLTEVTDGDLADAVTFDYSGTEAITVVKSRYSVSRQLKVAGITAFPNDARLVDDWPADLIATESRPIPEYTHDNVDDIGRRVHTLDSAGAEFRDTGLAAQFFRQQATEIFDRFGDGPIYGNIVGLAALESLKPGDWFRLTASNYPVFTTGARDGSTLVAQILETRQDPEGPTLRFLTGGPDDQPLTAPSVSLAQNGSRPKHDVDATISGMPAGADKYQLQIRETSSGAWRTVAEGTANETVTIRNLPSNTQIDAQVRATAGNATRSAWSTTASVTTAALTAPSTASATASGRTIRLTWVNGETDYGLMPTLNGADVLDEPLAPGTTAWTFAGLDASTGYTVGVKHVDPYGGESSVVTDTSTTGTVGTLAAPGNVRMLQGVASDDSALGVSLAYDPDRYPVKPTFGTGVEVAWERRDPYAVTVVEYDTSASFIDPTRVSAGGEDRVRISIPLDDTVRFFRVRHESEDGEEVSAWVSFHTGAISTTEFPISAQATPLESTSPGDVAIPAMTLELIPTVNTATQTRGFFIDVHFTATDRVEEVFVQYTWDDGGGVTSFAYTSTVTAEPGEDNAERLQNVGDFLFEEDWTSIEVVLVPITADALLGRPRFRRATDASETGQGVKAGLSAGGTAAADYFVSGSNVTIDTDSNGRPRINATSSGGASAINDLSDVTISGTPADDEVLAYDSGTGQWINQTAAEAGLSEVGHTHAASDIDSGTFADARISQSSVTQHEAALTLLGIEGLVDPNADRMLFWDDGAGAFAFLTPGTGLTISGTQINVSGFLTASGTGLTDDGSTVSLDYSGTDNYILAAPGGLLAGFDGTEELAIVDDDNIVHYTTLDNLPFAATSHTHDASDVTTGSFGATQIDFTAGLRNEGGALQVSIAGFSDTQPTLVQADELLVRDVSGAAGSDHYRVRFDEIGLSLFNNDANFTANAIDSASTGLVNVGGDVQIEYDTASNYILIAPGGLLSAFDGTEEMAIVDDDNVVHYTTLDNLEGHWSIGANQVTAGTFGAGTYTMPGDLRLSAIGEGLWLMNGGSLTTNGGRTPNDSRLINLRDGNPPTDGALLITNDVTTAGDAAGEIAYFSRSAIDFSVLDSLALTIDAGGVIVQAGTLEAQAGSVGAPGYGFEIDPDTGMYRAGANIIGFATAGVERFRVDGIDTTHGRHRFQNGQVHTVEGAEITRSTAGSVTLDWDAYNSVDLRNDGNIDTINVDDGSMQDGNWYTLVIRYASGTQDTITFSAVGTLQWFGGSAPTLPTATTGDRTVVQFYKTGGLTLAAAWDAPA